MTAEDELADRLKYRVEVNALGRYYRNHRGELHREDGPAVEYTSGGQVWWVNGELHREDGPAVICANGDQEWYLNGNLHREDGPAVVYNNGTKEWYLEGVLQNDR